MQQMMLMKMMAANQDSQAYSNLSDKHGSSSNGDENEIDNISVQDDNESIPKESLCLSEGDKLLLAEHKATEKLLFNFNSNVQDGIVDDENRSTRSGQSNHDSDWFPKEWKMSCTICSHTSISPSEFEQHIKAHLHAAVSASTSPEECSKSSPVKTNTTAAVLL